MEERKHGATHKLRPDAKVREAPSTPLRRSQNLQKCIPSRHANPGRQRDRTSSRNAKGMQEKAMQRNIR